MKDIMEAVHKNLKFTMETVSDFVENKLPTLDTSIWIEGGSRIEYKYFEKTMASNRVVNRNTAMGENAKIASLSQEIVRRMLKTSETVFKLGMI